MSKNADLKDTDSGLSRRSIAIEPGVRTIDPGDTNLVVVKWNPIEPGLFDIRLRYTKVEGVESSTMIDLKTDISYEEWKDSAFWLHGTADVPTQETLSEVMYINYSLHIQVAEIDGAPSIRIFGEIFPRWVIGDLVVDISTEGTD